MLAGFIKGSTSYLEAFRTIARFRLWGYFLAPALIAIFLGISILGTAWSVADDFGGWLISYYPFEWGRGTLEKVASVFGGLFTGAIGLILFKQLVLALASPFMSPLSERVEKELSGTYQPQPFRLGKFMQDLIRGIRIALRNITRELFFTLLLFILGLFPLFSPFTAILIFVVQAFYAGFGNMDFTLERHFNVRQSVRFVRANRGLAIGNGSIFLLLFLTGIGFLFALPLGTVAAAQETIKKPLD